MKSYKEFLTEISNKKLGQYIQKASSDIGKQERSGALSDVTAQNNANKYGHGSHDEIHHRVEADKSYRKSVQREAGIRKAVKKLLK